MAALEIYRGDTRVVNLTFTNDDGSVPNISGFLISYIAAQNYELSPVISKIVTGDGIIGPSGMANMTFTTGDTTQCPGQYLAVFKLQDLTGALSTFNTDGLNILPNLPSS